MCLEIIFLLLYQSVAYIPSSNKTRVQDKGIVLTSKVEEGGENARLSPYSSAFWKAGRRCS